MFDALSDRLESAWKKLRGQDKISQSNIQDALREVRRALLEADVNLQVVKDFISEVETKAQGADVVAGVRPDQQFIKIVHDELVRVMGAENVPLAETEEKPTIVLMAGLQGTGKTTATAKLALHLRKLERSCLLVATDVYRPAAIDQLVTLGKQIDVPVFELGSDADPVEIARQGVERAKAEGFNTVIIDTAGRLQIDEDMMGELARIKATVQPHETLLVVDSMTGQEAANLTRTFHDKIGITGAILTKLDGDTRGGAALSVRQISGAPIKFVGVGEKVEALQPFYPERMASRILGMGDVLSLVEKAQEEFDLADAEKMQDKILSAKFDFNDFVKQLRMLKNMGSLGGIMKLIPGMNKISDEQLKQGETQLKRCESMINSMTRQERQDPDLLASSPSRRRRIAKGSGYREPDVSKLVADFQKMRTLMQQMGQGQMPAGMPGMFGGGGMGNPFGGGDNSRPSSPGWRGYNSGDRTTKKKKNKEKKKKGFGTL
ncbi:signal recognition particle protein [Nodularia spumigena CS-584]|jgi:signal recognition particle subunit SRP54|uniref:Signal recognition particle protein n=2 Tax=Nodularia spumigena TaxID=70799 RepID=A0A2S0Q8A4_NODSP|nr:signal recognition particle protein [Nodularia spumigena]AHJ27167.1 Signal recognition particle, subunit Ffh SRP54 [Nodularia spumigena CCY9414]AVZ30540.1 signal recognition particle protein [Nodularia spumigena UHCC 0039]EAW46006.1 signal recognition particle protein [Nodularia spumigena CCY9414]MDB9381454.1 signal recognition particle protein [Nodularia spumigena CS-584]MEA5524881.1 signal recognition particle protein [Nodularia spumigena UHCC 0143]